MAKVKMLNMAGAEVGEVTLNDEIFGIEPNEIAVQTVVKNYLARDYRYAVPKKVKRLALKSVLSAKVADKEIIVLDELKFAEPKTKEMVKVLENIKADKKALIVMDEKDENVVRSASNIQGVRTALVSTMNVYEIINHYSLVLTKAAAERIEEVYA